MTNASVRYIFFGTPEFASIILERLIGADMMPVAVVTNPDRPAGRKKVVSPPPVKQYLLKSDFNRIEILQPEQLDATYAVQLRALGADVGILAAYGKIIPKEIIAVFPKGIIVVHPSLLPRYRGSTPIQSVILTGERETGTTLLVMDEKIDHGKIISNAKLLISNDDTYETLSKKLAGLSADVLIETLPKYLRGEIVPRVQDHARATYTKKFATEDGFINYPILETITGTSDVPWTSDVQKLAEAVWRKVRALNPEPGVWTIKDNKRMKILEVGLPNIPNRRFVLKKIQYAGEKPKKFP